MKKLQALLFFALTFLPTLLTAGPPDLRKTTISNRVGFADIILIMFCVGLGLLAFSLFCSVMKPKLVKAGGERLSKGLIKPFVAGLLLAVVYALFYKLCDNISASSLRHYARAGVFILAFTHFAFGFVLVANYVGERILVNSGSLKSGTFLPVLFGGIVLLFMNYFFVVGNLAFLFCAILALGIIPITALRK